MPDLAFLHGPYLRFRTRARSFVLKYPRLDMAVGRTLVRIDAALRNSGLISVSDRSSTTFHYRGAEFTFNEQNRTMADGILSTGDYEPETLECILRVLKPGSTFVDLGASIGVFSVLAGRAVGPGGHIHAFEPTPATAALLRRNVETNGLRSAVTVVEMAVSNEPGRARFAIFDVAQGNSIAVASDKAVETLEVEVTTLDLYFARLGWPKVDLIKMDVEGQERQVFEGMRALASRNPGMAVIFEYHGGQLLRTGTSGADLIAAVRAAGFDSFEVLFRKGQRLDLPADLPVLEKLSTRAAFNVLAWRSSSAARTSVA